MQPKMVHLFLATALGLLAANDADAQSAAVCAEVKIEILQRLTFERIAFDARLVMTNNLPTDSLENFGVNLVIQDPDGNDAGALFFIGVADTENIAAVDGTGSLAAGVRAEAHWLLIPVAGAGGTAQIGRNYTVGGSVSFTVGGETRELGLFPAPITVRPQPLLEVNYFLPAAVVADDPFTEPVEAPVPFSLGVRVVNRGFGSAGNLRIESGQPQIVENIQGLLIAFQLLGTSVNGEPVQPTLNATFGTIPPMDCGIAVWEMVTTLSGEFISFDASYTHQPELGGELTSLIQDVTSYVLVREMLVDVPGRDDRKDFLTDVDRDPENVPDQIFESDCNELPVFPVAGSTVGIPALSGGEVTLTTDILPNWVFSRVDDPAQGLIPLVGVTRSDGKQLRPENFWISRVQNEDDRTQFFYFANIIDRDTTGSYTLMYEAAPPDSTAPVTSIIFQEPSFGFDPTYIAPETQMLFTAADDISGVASIERALDADPFEPAFPFEITALGAHVIRFRSTDNAGNQEADQSVDVVVDDAPPVIDPIVAVPGVFVPGAPDGSDVARTTMVTLHAIDVVPNLTGVLDIAVGTGPVFDDLTLVRSLPFSLPSGVPSPIVWDGKGLAGVAVPDGMYTLRATVTDPLGRTANVETVVEAAPFTDDQEAEGAADSDQRFPDLVGDTLVWQDNRAGNWDIFHLTLGSGPATNLTPGQMADQERPSTDGTYVVWQDRRNGNWDIFLYEIATMTTTPFATEIEDQTNPVVAAPWIVWQEQRGGQADIVARNIGTGETVEISSGDPGSHDQLRPAITSGTTVAFEDYRFGLAEIFTYDFGTRVERRITNNIDNQTRVTIDGSTLVWVDQRDGNRELYTFDLITGIERRMTYTKTDESQPDIQGGRISYTDFAAGLGDPTVAIHELATRRSLRITADPNRQEEPTTYGNRVAWHDDRTGRWQIRTADVSLGSLPIGRTLAPGLNLVGPTDTVAAAFPNAFALLTEWNATSGITEIQKFDPASGLILSARIPGGSPEGDDFPVIAGDALLTRSPGTGVLSLSAPGTCPAVPIVAGANYVSLACVPPGFTAQDWVLALGLDKISSIARYDTNTGRWTTLAVDQGSLVGENFEIQFGEGYLIYAREAAGPFQP